MKLACIFKEVKTKRKNFRKSWKSICWHFNILPQLPYTTSERELYYYQQKLNVWLASRVGDQLKTYDLRKLVNFKEILETLGIDGKVLSLPPKKQIWQLCYKTVKNRLQIFHRKAWVNLFRGFIYNILSKVAPIDQFYYLRKVAFIARISEIICFFSLFICHVRETTEHF